MVVSWIVLNEKANDDFGPGTLAFYMSKGLVKTAEGSKGMLVIFPFSGECGRIVDRRFLA